MKKVIVLTLAFLFTAFCFVLTAQVWNYAESSAFPSGNLEYYGKLTFLLTVHLAAIYFSQQKHVMR